MPDTPDIASIAGLMGDPTRAAMLTMLMDGTAHTATELALEGGVAPSTASSHLARLATGGLVAMVKQGRHRYFRIATPEVAAAVEGLTTIAPPGGGRKRRTGPGDERLRSARVCYDHLAGEAGVRLLQRLREEGLMGGEFESIALTDRGEAWCARIGIDLAALRRRRRPLYRYCLDWSERRMHLAGALGAALAERLFALRYARRETGSRVVILSPQGQRFIERPHMAR